MMKLKKITYYLMIVTGSVALMELLFLFFHNNAMELFRTYGYWISRLLHVLFYVFFTLFLYELYRNQK